MNEQELSLTEENYLKIIYKLEMEHKGEVTTNAIADLTNTKAASVSDMLKRLSQKVLVNYIKYQGVTLTPEGRKKALMVIRKHRLWEVFLVDQRGYSLEADHEIAEQLEHIESLQLVDQLEKVLGYPPVDPHGDPIPNAKGEMPNKKQIFLKDMQINQKGQIMGVKDTSPLFLKYLDKIGIGIGTEFEIIDRVEYDQSVELNISGRLTIISKEVAQNLFTIE